MKKITIALMLFMLFGINTSAFAYYCHPSCTHRHPHYYRSSYHYHHSSVYVVNREYFEDVQNFPNCKKHSLIAQTTVYYYSDGSRRSYTYYSILKEDGTILDSGLSEVRHVIQNKNHYFLVRKSGKYKILDSNGVQLSKRQYTKMTEILPNILLVRADKKYGMIDIQENIIIPIKYKSIEKIGTDIFLTKLNGYWGIISSKNEILVKNEYEKIKPLYDTFLLKKYGKYGLADINGNILFEAKYDKIKKLGEYIIVKNNNEYQVLDSTGNLLTDKKYKKIRLERNILEGKIKSFSWEKIELL